MRRFAREAGFLILPVLIAAVPAPGWAAAATVAGTASAAALSSTWIALESPFTGDDDRDGWTVYELGLAAGGPFDLAEVIRLPGRPRWRADSFRGGLIPDTDYFVQVTYVDPDGVSGASTQVLGPIHTPASAPDAVTLGPTLVEVGETEIYVSVPISDDANINSSGVVEIATDAAGPWTEKCGNPAERRLPFHPKRCRLRSLTPGTDYWVRVSMTDPDGVNGASATQVLGPYTFTGLANLALGRPITGDPGWGCCPNPAELVDGRIQARNWMNGFAWWGGLNGYAGGPAGWKQVTVDLGAPTTFDRVEVWLHDNNSPPTDWTVETSDDGATWSMVWSTTDPQCRGAGESLNGTHWAMPACSQRAVLSPATARYVRYSFDDRTLFGGLHGWAAEVEIFPPVPPETLVLQPGPEGKDTSGRWYEPDVNFGDWELMNCGISSSHLATFVEFDLAALPTGAEIVSADLSLWGEYREGTLTVSTVGEPWGESTLTWNNRPSSGPPEISAPIDTTPFGSVKTFDVTSLVQPWADAPATNHGFAVTASTGNIGWIMASSDNTTYPRPLLEISYHPPVAADLDFGDAPDATIGAPWAYPTSLAADGARHEIVAGVALGALIDAETDGVPSAAAMGDDSSDLDDEDGVVFTSPLAAGAAVTLDVAASAPGLLSAWVDFDADGDWADAGEQVFQDEPLVAGVNPLGFVVPAGASLGLSFARFRFSSVAGLGYDGAAPDGEVEDYAVDLVDGTPPTDPVVTSTSHAASVWSNLDQIEMSWSSADDGGGSGVAGYSVLFDTVAATLPDAAIDVAHGADPHTTTSASLADGQSHYFHLRTCDHAGNCTSTVHSGPFWIDATDPTDPAAVASTSHTVGVADSVNVIDMTWTASGDAASGVDGYAYVFSDSMTPSCDASKDLEETATSVSSGALADGSKWFHICAVDNAGNWTTPVSAGPYVVDTSQPADPTVVASTSHTPSAWSSVPAVTVEWSGAADGSGSGVAGYSVLFDTAASTLPDATIDVAHAADPHTTTSPPLADGQDHYFHLRTCDQAANCTTTVHLGPFWIDTAPPGVLLVGSDADTGDGALTEGEISSAPITSLTVFFDEEVTGADDAGNYLLAASGGAVQTSSCLLGVDPADTSIAIDGAAYDPLHRTGTLDVNGGVPLLDGAYRLLVCGSTSIADAAGNALDGDGDGGGGDDFVRSFTLSETRPTAHPGADRTIDVHESILLGDFPPASGGTAPYSYAWAVTPDEDVELSSASEANPTMSCAAPEVLTAELVVTDASSLASESAAAEITVVCPLQKDFFNVDFFDAFVWEAMSTITAEQSVVRDGAEITFRAGDQVVLMDGFLVEPGGRLAVEIVPGTDCE